MYGERPVRLRKSPQVIAHERSQLIEESFERHRFMAAFRLGQDFGPGDDGYKEFHRALEVGDSVTVAGLIEGQASTRTGRTCTEPVEQRSARRTRSYPRLTPDERTALLDVGRGLTAHEAARLHDVGQSAIEHRRSRARGKLGTDTVRKAVFLAIIAGEFTVHDLMEGMTK